MPIDLADYHRIALLLGLETIDDVIRWADEEISRSEVLEPALTDISLGRLKPTHEVESLLLSLVVNHHSSALKAVLAELSAGVARDTVPVDEAIDRIWNYAKVHFKYSELCYSFAGLAEDLACIRDGILTQKDVASLRQPLLETLNGYCESSADEGGEAR
jgi:hypothetical protein